jgi:hypothetical protein
MDPAGEEVEVATTARSGLISVGGGAAGSRLGAVRSDLDGDGA